MIDILLEEKDWDMILDGLEALKSRDLSGELIGGIMEAMFAPKKDASQSEKDEWEKTQTKRKFEREAKIEGNKEFKKEIDILKSKIILMQNQDNNILKGRNIIES